MDRYGWSTASSRERAEDGRSEIMSVSGIGLTDILLIGGLLERLGDEGGLERYGNSSTIHILAGMVDVLPVQTAVDQQI